MELEEGKITNGILYNRMVRNNKNFLCAFTGPTGSGKSWSCLRFCELWYERKFNQPFPKENICFHTHDVMERLVHGNLKRGELLILEEAGTSMGSLDFQNKISKLFNYILQTFRSRNLGLVLNLPYVSMLNKQTRMLLHMKFQTIEIDKQKKKCWLKPLMIQINQMTRKDYNKFPRAIMDGVSVPIQQIGFSQPSDRLIEEYEDKKHEFVSSISKDVLNDMRRIQSEKRKPLTEKQEKIVNCWKEGMSVQKEIAAKIGRPASDVCLNIGYMKRKGYYPEDYLEKEGN